MLPDIPQPKQHFEVVKPYVLKEDLQLSMHRHFLCPTTHIQVSIHKPCIFKSSAL